MRYMMPKICNAPARADTLYTAQYVWLLRTMRDAPQRPASPPQRQEPARNGKHHQRRESQRPVHADQAADQADGDA